MNKIIVKFNNGTQTVLSYSEEQINVLKLTQDIGLQLYPETYNSKIDQYIKLIHMGKISALEDIITFEPIKQEHTFHCVVKKIPESAFVIEKSPLMTTEEVNNLLANPKFINLITQRSVFEFLSQNLDSQDKLNGLISGKGNQNITESVSSKYAQQISILKEMGFTDENELEALLSNANGNLENVINILMG